MKNYIYLFMVSLLILNFFSCNTEPVTVEPDQIGRQVFEILKELNVKTKAEYLENFMSIEELRAMAQNMELPLETNLRNELTNMLKMEFEEQMEKDYNQIKEDAASEGIVWQNIEYLDYVYEKEVDRGLEGTTGKLFFKYENYSYKVDVTTLFDGNEYRLLEIEDFYEQY
jgi:hypothetical protein